MRLDSSGMSLRGHGPMCCVLCEGSFYTLPPDGRAVGSVLYDKG